MICRVHCPPPRQLLRRLRILSAAHQAIHCVAYSLHGVSNSSRTVASHTASIPKATIAATAGRPLPKASISFEPAFRFQKKISVVPRANFTLQGIQVDSNADVVSSMARQTHWAVKSAMPSDLVLYSYPAASLAIFPVFIRTFNAGEIRSRVHRFAFSMTRGYSKMLAAHWQKRHHIHYGLFKDRSLQIQLHHHPKLKPFSNFNQDDMFRPAKKTHTPNRV